MLESAKLSPLFSEIYSMRFAFTALLIVSPLFLLAQIHPQSLNGLSLWVNADESVVTLPNGKVTDWLDLSGSNNHLFQGTDSRRPVLFANVLNGRAGVWFDGVNDQLDFPEIEGIRAVFWVIRESDNVTPATRGLLGHSSTYHFIRGPNSLIWDGVNTNSGILQGNTRLRFQEIDGTQTLMPPGYQLISLRSTQGLEANRFTKDRNSNPTVWSGELLQLLIYTQELSEEEVLGVENWLADYYSPVLSAGEDVFIDYGFCDTTLTASIGFPAYTWSDGTQSQSIQVSQTGWYWVEATDPLGRVLRDSVHVQFPGNFQPSGTFLCQGEEFVWDTGLDPESYSFLWQDGSTGSSHSLQNNGLLELTVTDSVGCTYVVPPVQVVFDDFAVTAGINPDTELCIGEPVALQGGDFPGLTYEWNGWFSGAVYTYAGETEITLEVINANGCTALDTLLVTSLGTSPQVAFQITGNCFEDNSLFTYTGVSENPVISWEWDFDGLGQASGESVAYYFDSPGTYAVGLSVLDDNGCTGTLIQNVEIHPKPIAGFEFPALCTGISALFESSSLVESGSLISQDWTFPGQAISGSQAEFVFTEPGFQEVSLLVSSNEGCADEHSVFVLVQPSPVPDFNASNLCFGSLSDFEALVDENGAGPVESYSWSFGDNTGSSLANPSHFYTATGAYTVSLSVIAENGCPGTAQENLVVSLPPVPAFGVDQQCEGDLTVLQDQTEAQGETLIAWNWTIAGLGAFEGGSVSLVFPAPGPYEVSMTVLSSTGCTAQIVQQVDIYPLPEVSFTHSPEIGSAPLEVTFTADVDLPVSVFQWYFGDGNTALGNASIAHTYSGNGSYTAGLTAISTQGCEGHFTREVLVDEPLLDLNILYAGMNADGFAEALVLNEGNYSVEELDFFQREGDGPWYREVRYGRIEPGQTAQFVFSSAPANSDAGGFFCVAVNDGQHPQRETDLDDNERCIARESEEFSILHAWPIPFDTWINVAFVSPIRSRVNLRLYTTAGAEVYSFEGQAETGYNRYRLDIAGLASGTYILEAEIENGVAVKYLFGGR